MKRELKRRLWTPAAWRDRLATVVHFHRSDVQRATLDVSTFWQEINHPQTNACKQSFHHKCLQLSRPPSFKRPDRLTAPSPFPPKLSQKTKNSSGNTKERPLYCIYIQYLIAAPDASPVGRWRAPEGDRQQSSANYQTWGSHKQKKNNAANWNDSKRRKNSESSNSLHYCQKRTKISSEN